MRQAKALRLCVRRLGTKGGSALEGLRCGQTKLRWRRLSVVGSGSDTRWVAAAVQAQRIAHLCRPAAAIWCRRSRDRDLLYRRPVVGRLRIILRQFVAGGALPCNEVLQVRKALRVGADWRIAPHPSRPKGGCCRHSCLVKVRVCLIGEDDG